MAKRILSLFFGLFLSLSLAADGGYKPVKRYDPSRDAVQDIDAAAAEAARSGRLVLLEIGGEWCVWCHYLDDFLATHGKIRKSLEETFVVVKVNFGPKNKNEQALSRYPKIKGYPHLFILGADGKYLGSQDTGELEKGKSYDPKVFQAFIDKWRAQTPSAAASNQ